MDEVGGDEADGQDEKRLAERCLHGRFEPRFLEEFAEDLRGSLRYAAQLHPDLQHAGQEGEEELDEPGQPHGGDEAGQGPDGQFPANFPRLLGHRDDLLDRQVDQQDGNPEEGEVGQVVDGFDVVGQTGIFPADDAPVVEADVESEGQREEAEDTDDGDGRKQEQVSR